MVFGKNMAQGSCRIPSSACHSVTDLRSMTSSRHIALLSSLVLCIGFAFAQSDTATVRVLRSACDVSLSLERLRSLPEREVVVKERDGSESKYSGAWLSEVLDLGCDSTTRLDKHATLRSVVKVVSADGFVSVVAMAEVAEGFAERPVLLVWSRNGLALSERHGPLQLLVPDDLKPGRNVRQVKMLEVITP